MYVDQFFVAEAKTLGAQSAVLMNVRIDLPSGAKTYLHWWHRAARAGDPEAQALLGTLYSYGDEIAQVPEIGFYWHLKAAENGHVGSQLIVAGYYLEGWADFPSEIEEAEKWYERAAEAGSAEAKFELAKLRFLSKDDNIDIHDPELDEIFVLFQDSAFGGHAMAPGIVSQFFRAGIGTAQDVPFAYAWGKFARVREYCHGRDMYIEACKVAEPDEMQLGERLFATLQRQVPSYAIESLRQSEP